jgi:hypothetical protein
MAVLEGHRANFNMLLRAAQNGDLALLESKDAKTGEYRALICAIAVDDQGMFNVTPFGHLCNDNPYEEYADPTIDDSHTDSPVVAVR